MINNATKEVKTNACNKVIFVQEIDLNKIEDYAWTEIDDEQMLDRALSLIYPKIKQNEKI